MDTGRRRLLAQALCGCALCGLQKLHAAVLQTDIAPLVRENYQPVDADEKGLWQSVERFEEELAASDLLLRDPKLSGYALQVVERLLGRPATDLRIYITHDASFNASMFPSGMMLINTGLLVRTRNEAQLAAVLGHESGHYFRKHSLAGFRDQRSKTATMAFIQAGAAIGAGSAARSGSTSGSSWMDVANSINAGLIASVFQFSRDQEREADAYGLGLMARAGYTPDAAASVWAQLIGERKASAAARKRMYRDWSASPFSTHPPTTTRMTDLSDTAKSILAGGAPEQFDRGLDRWREAISPHLPMLLDEQVKLNDPGASLYLIDSLATDGWTGVLYFFRGEAFRLRGHPGDDALAADAYAAAVSLADAPPESWKAHGYALRKAGRKDESRVAFAHYLELRPAASDGALVRSLISQ